MNEERDPLELALEALKTRSRGRVMSDLKMEGRLMQEFDRVRVQRRHRRTTALVAGVALAVSSVGFAAAGGVEVVKGWFVQVELVNTNGEGPSAPDGLPGSSVTFELQGRQLLDANGNAVGELTVTDGDEQLRPADADGSR